MGYKFRDENLGKLYENYATINISHCISCGKTDFENWAESGPYKTYKCLNCQLIFMNPQLNEDGLNNYYSNYNYNRQSNCLAWKKHVSPWHKTSEYML